MSELEITPDEPIPLRPYPTPVPARMLRVGHKGADSIVAGNSPASFDAALAAGVDMIEFDILPLDYHDRTGSPLVLAHDYDHMIESPPTLDEGLAHLASAPFAGVEFDVDLKLPGYEQRVLEALMRHSLLDRTLISTTYPRSLAIIRALEPRVRLGWSVPRVKRDYTAQRRTLPIAIAGLALWRQGFPPRAAAAIRAGYCHAIMAYWQLVTPRLVTAVREAGGEIYAWTVDEKRQIAALEAMGVTGVITNDPRLFDTLPAAA